MRAIRWRLAVAFVLPLVFAGAVAAAGFRGLSRVVSVTDAILERCARRVEHASSLEIHTRDLRRHEKGVFLGIAEKSKAAESFTWWKASHEAALADLAELRKLAGGEDAAAIAAIGERLAIYATRFEAVERAIAAGSIRTPEGAVAAMEPALETIRGVDRLTATLVRTSLARMHAQGSVVLEAEANARAAMRALCIAAIVAAAVLHAFVMRGVARRIHPEDFHVPEAGGVVPYVDA